MKDTEFIKHIKLNDYEIDIGIDDYGQCYFYEYKDKRGNLVQASCGSYNTEYLEYIYYELDPIYRELVRLDLYDELEGYKLALLNHYKQEFSKMYDIKQEKPKLSCLYSDDDWDVKKRDNKLIISHFTNCHFDNELVINLEDWNITSN